jgi:hypothetical protein
LEKACPKIAKNPVYRGKGAIRVLGLKSMSGYKQSGSANDGGAKASPRPRTSRTGTAEARRNNSIRVSPARYVPMDEASSALASAALAELLAPLVKEPVAERSTP